MLASRKQSVQDHAVGPSPEGRGVSYDGALSDDGKREGRGVMRWPDGGRYDGQWKRGRMEGEGRFLYASGDAYVGHFKDNRKDGTGSYQFANGDKYVGEFSDDCEHGYGAYTWKSGDSYAGYWKRGYMHGYGVMAHRNGEVYMGWHFLALRNGRGRLQRADGSYYVGEWVRGRREGKGVMVLASGEGYNGYWRDDAMHGEGTWFAKDGERHSGPWHYASLRGTAYNPQKMAQEHVEVDADDAGCSPPRLPAEPPAVPGAGGGGGGGGGGAGLVDAAALWWSDDVAGEPHLSEGWLQDGVIALRREFAPPPEPPPEDPAAAAAAAAYAAGNAGTPLRKGAPPPQRGGAADTFRRLCIEAGARINAQVVDILAGMTTHEVCALDASKTYVGDKGALVLCRLLSLCPNTAMVGFQGLLLGQAPIAALAREAARHPKLRSVDLRGNFIEHPAAKALHRTLCLNSNVEHLHLDGCGVNAGLLRQIDERLRYNTRVNANRLGTARIP